MDAVLYVNDRKNSLLESILNCIESAITMKFGENVYRVIYANFKARFGLEKKDTVSQPEKFEQLLDEIFGTGIASELIKRSIFNELANRFNIFPPLYYERIENKDTIVSQSIKEILKNAQ